jgi:hypothetical protein
MAEAIQKAEKEDTLLLSAEMDDTVEGEQTSTGNSVPDTSQTVGGSEGTTANVTLTEEVKP